MTTIENDEEIDPGQIIPLMQTAILNKLPNTTIRRIKSEQVVTDITSCVKELLENALDAQATQITIRLEDCGTKTIEIEDNGYGIHPDHHSTFAQMHYTSKITSFDDLNFITSFGFRGEALPSICNLAESVKVTTRTLEDDEGTVLQLDKSGRLIRSEKKKNVQVGTLITIKNLYWNFPVRKEAMNKTKHTQVKKLLELIHAYCLGHPSVQLELDYPPRPLFKKKQFENAFQIIDFLYGNNFSNGLEKIEFTFEENDEIFIKNYLKHLVLYLPSKKAVDATKFFRSSNDRCFFLLNSRPVDLPNEMKLIFKYLRKFFAVSSKSYPFILFQLEMDPSSFDLNYTSNKRKIVFTDQKFLTEFLESRILIPNYQQLENKKDNNNNNKNNNNKNVTKNLKNETGQAQGGDELSLIQNFDPTFDVNLKNTDESFGNNETFERNNQDMETLNQNIQYSQNFMELDDDLIQVNDNVLKTENPPKLECLTPEQGKNYNINNNNFNKYNNNFKNDNVNNNNYQISSSQQTTLTDFGVIKKPEKRNWTQQTPSQNPKKPNLPMWTDFSYNFQLSNLQKIREKNFENFKRYESQQEIEKKNYFEKISQAKNSKFINGTKIDKDHLDLIKPVGLLEQKNRVLVKIADFFFTFDCQKAIEYLNYFEATQNFEPNLKNVENQNLIIYKKDISAENWKICLDLAMGVLESLKFSFRMNGFLVEGKDLRTPNAAIQVVQISNDFGSDFGLEDFQELLSLFCLPENQNPEKRKFLRIQKVEKFLKQKISQNSPSFTINSLTHSNEILVKMKDLSKVFFNLYSPKFFLPLTAMR